MRYTNTMPKDLQEQIIYKLGEISSSTTEIKEHLKALNGKVASHEKYINIENGKKEERNKEASIAGYKSGGIVSGVSAIVILIFNLLSGR